jgi:hypothetical protein
VGQGAVGALPFRLTAPLAVCLLHAQLMNYAEAEVLYSKAIALCPGDATYYANRAAARMMLRNLQVLRLPRRSPCPCVPRRVPPSRVC